MAGWALPAALGAAQFFGNRSARRSSERENRRGINEARGHLNQIEPTTRGIYNPYIRHGFDAENSLPGMYQGMYDEYANNNTPEEYGQMSGDPMEFINNIMRGYTPSEGYKYKEKRMTDAARAAGAAGGFSGTELDRESQADMIKGLLGGDMQEFLNNILGTQKYGLEGAERYNERNMLGKERARALGAGSQEQRTERGFRAASDLASILGNNSGQQANLGLYGSRQSQVNNNRYNGANADLMGRMMDMYQGGAFNNMGSPFGR